MIHLIIPPVSDCFMPTLGVAQIAGYLKDNGIACKAYDASAELMHILLEGWNDQKGIFFDGKENGNYTYKNIAECLNRYSGMSKNLKIAMDDFQTGFSWRELDMLQEYIEKEDYFTKELAKISFIHEENPKTGEEEWYGFSISYDCQVIPTMLLAHMLKQRKPEVKIGIGGSLLYNYENDFYKLIHMTNWVDMLMIGAGEEAWKYIGLKRIEELDSLSGIEVSHMQGKYMIDTRKRKRKPIVYEPDFSDFHFEYYPSREKAFPYMIKDRCYYGKCHFCNGDKVEEQSTAKDIKISFGKMHEIAEITGIHNVYIVDAALSPMDLEIIAGLPDMGLQWIANGRFEKNLTDERLIAAIAKKGCVMLRFGLESASQKILNYMNKGTKVDIAEKVLNLAARHGIRNHVYLMFGYPGETKEDREMTIEFVKRNRMVISSYSVSLFQPIPGTKVYQELLEKIGRNENIYERMIQLIYKDEYYYAEIYQDISRLNDVLRGYAKTNVEYYSANIFNQFADGEGTGPEKIFDRKDHIMTKEEIQKEISIQFLPENKW